MVISAAPSTSLSSAALGLVVGLIVLALLLYRQLRVRAVQSTLVLPGVLALLGLFDLSNYVNHHPLSTTAIATLLFSLLVFAIGLGVARAWTVRLWMAGGQAMRQGTWLTVVLWLAAVGLHLAVDSTSKVGAASLIFYLGLSLGAQQLAVRWRARHMAAVVPRI
jgi:hypothetical protein